MSEERKQYLEFIQGAIIRMAANSFQLKGWAITVVTALWAIYASNSKEIFILIGIFPTVLFAFLDAYYLLLERRYRHLYDDVAGVSLNPIRTTIRDYDMDINRDYTGKKLSFFSALFSISILALYVFILAFQMSFYVLIKLNIL